MKFEELKFIILNKRQGITKNNKDYYQIKLGSNLGLTADIFVNKDIFLQVDFFEDVTEFVRVNFINNKLSFNLAI